MKHQDGARPNAISTKEAENLSVTELLKKLSSSEKGISVSEAEERLKKYGYNEISEKKVNPLIKFLSYFWGPIPWMIEIAALLSAVVKHWADLIIISALLIFNGMVGFWQEFQAGNAIEQFSCCHACSTLCYQGSRSTGTFKVKGYCVTAWSLLRRLQQYRFCSDSALPG